MAKGRKPKPFQLHKLDGTYRKDRHSDLSEGLSVSKPKCPSYLPAKARTAFKELRDILADDMKVLTQADRWALEMLCDAWNDYREAQRIVAKEGAFYDTYTNEGAPMKRPHPAVADRNDAWRRVKSMLSEFGLTPASRTSVVKQVNGKMDKTEPKKAKTW